MSPIVLFDLDDTLYPEAAYVRSGHRVIAQRIAARTGNTADSVYSTLRYDYCKFGRAGLFDRMIEAYGLPADIVRELVKSYRLHKPELTLDPEVRRLLATLRSDYRIAIVTDGDVNMQKAKVEALGLSGLVDLVVYCWEQEARKPEPGAFIDAVHQLGGHAEGAIIIGDDPTHDVEAAVRMGAGCVRIRANRFAEIESGRRPARYTEIDSVLETPAAIDRLATGHG
ncbi:MAG: HAD family hydrolase [Hoeflea sp.]|uniref:HAD family hydrolase n=1 Tax=Hoeflea sp. TaxID=1940281 RepID=UPI0032968E21